MAALNKLLPRLCKARGMSRRKQGGFVYVGALRALLGGGKFTPRKLFGAGEPGFHGETYNPDVLLARRNKITFSQDFSQAIWTKDNVVPTYNNVVAPDGTLTASTFADNANASTHRLFYTFAAGATAGPRSLHVKMGTRRWVYFEDAGGGARVYYDLLNGVMGTQNAGATGAIAAVAGAPGWFRLSYFPTTAVAYVALGMTQNDNGQGYAGVGDTIIVWGAQVDRDPNTVSAYQYVTDWNTEYLAAAGASSVGMWQDSAGTTAVTAVEQPVGKWMDWKSGKGAAGNHATQATAGSRPVLSARYNLFTKSEQFDDAAWAKSASTVTANVAIDPFGGNGADKLCEDGSTGFHSISQSISASGAVRFQAYLKAGDRAFAVLGLIGVLAVGFDLTTGATNTIAGAPTAKGATNVGNGWWRCWFEYTSGTTFQIFPATSLTTYSYAGTAGMGVYVWGADIRTQNDWAALANPAYQRVNTATDYDSAGFIHYLKFDGIDDSLQTPNIDFTGVNKMTVWAGATKLADAATAVITELGSGAITGSFYAALNGGASNFVFDTEGLAPHSTGAFVGVPAPRTAVLVSQCDNAGATQAAQLAARMDGVAQPLTYSAGPTAASNFSNAPLNIGRRNNSTLPLNGRLTSLTVRGTTTPTSQAFIAKMEQYAAALAGETFVSS